MSNEYILQAYEARDVLHWVKCLNAEGHAKLSDLLLAQRIANKFYIPLDDELWRDLKKQANISIDAVTSAIGNQYRLHPWFQSVGIARPDEVVLHLKKKPIKYEQFQEQMRTFCEPYKVRFEITGRMRPAI